MRLRDVQFRDLALDSALLTVRHGWRWSTQWVPLTAALVSRMSRGRAQHQADDRSKQDQKYRSQMPFQIVSLKGLYRWILT